MKRKAQAIYVSRLKSFAWRTGMMTLAMFVDFTAQNVGLFELPPEATVLLGLILGEVSKYLNGKR